MGVKPRHLQQRLGKTLKQQKCGSIAEFFVFHGQHSKPISQSFRKCNKCANCFVVLKRQLKFFGHVICKGKLEDLTLSGGIPGKHARGAQHFTFINNFKHLCQSCDNYGMLK